MLIVCGRAGKTYRYRILVALALTVRVAWLRGRPWDRW